MNCIFIKNVAKLVKIPVITLAEIRTVTKILPCIDFLSTTIQKRDTSLR